jgi:hypothetical protein
MRAADETVLVLTEPEIALDFSAILSLPADFGRFCRIGARL